MLQTCTYCGRQEESEWLCPQGHYVCEDCRAASAEEIVRRTTLATTATDPVQIADLLMKHPVFAKHGPAHHLLTAPVLLAALRNQGDVIPSQFTRGITPGRILAAIQRVKDIPQAACATRGDCGAAVGLGCAVSLLTGAGIRSDRERSLVLRATAQALARVADLGGSRCCRQSVYATLETARDFLKNELGIVLGLSQPVRCGLVEITEECKQKHCVYYPTNTLP